MDPTVEGMDSSAEEFVTDFEDKNQEQVKDQAQCARVITRRKKTKEERAGPRKRRKNKNKNRNRGVALDMGEQQLQHGKMSCPIADLKSLSIAPESADLDTTSMSTWNDWYQTIIKQSSLVDNQSIEEVPVVHAEEEEVDIKWWKTSYFLSKEYVHFINHNSKYIFTLL